MSRKYIYILLFVAGFKQPAQGQHISGAMQFANPVLLKDSNRISIAYSNLFYFRDYEFFHNIQTGYTLFGSWHYPRIVIQPNKWLKLEAGILLQKEFGDQAFDKAWPLFSLQLQKNGFRFIIGALESNQTHQLVEPLMSYDKVIERPIEQGFECKLDTKRVKADIWLDWERRQKINADYPEELTGGLSLTYTITQPGKALLVKVPIQFIAPHKGGQLDTNHSIVTTVLNRATGLWTEWDNPNHGNWIKQLRTDGYYLGYNHFHKSNLYPFDSGNGFLLNFFLRSKWDISFLGSFWKGHQYIAPKGVALYQSISSITGRTNYKEPERELLFLNLLYEKEIFPGLFIDLRYSPYIDLYGHYLEHAFLVLFSYRNIFGLGKLKSPRG